MNHNPYSQPTQSPQEQVDPNNLLTHRSYNAMMGARPWMLVVAAIVGIGLCYGVIDAVLDLGSDGVPPELAALEKEMEGSRSTGDTVMAWTIGISALVVNVLLCVFSLRGGLALGRMKKNVLETEIRTAAKNENGFMIVFGLAISAAFLYSAYQVYSISSELKVLMEAANEAEADLPEE